MKKKISRITILDNEFVTLWYYPDKKIVPPTINFINFLATRKKRWSG
ncbi:MAG: hypothetical protein RBT80_05020 [Candidatus Vecturithrix sp.]|jgi:hypothetical protein|nr:hypothetical protein [Candidatus Vecturithrix sp.]